MYDHKDPSNVQELGYLDEVISTCIELKSVELLGLSLKDLLMLDRTTFKRLQSRLQEYRKKEKDAMANATKDLTNKNPLGGK